MAKDEAVSPLEKILRDAAKTYPERGESRNAYLTRLARALAKVEDRTYDGLSDAAQVMFNEVISAYKAKEPYPVFPDAEGGSALVVDPDDDEADADEAKIALAEDDAETPTAPEDDESDGGLTKEKEMAAPAKKKKAAPGGSKKAASGGSKKEKKEKAPPAPKERKAATKRGEGRIKFVWGLLLKKPDMPIDDLFAKVQAKFPNAKVTRSSIKSARSSFSSVAQYIQDAGYLKDPLYKPKAD